MLGVPEELGGAVAERSAVTARARGRGARARRHGPRGRAARAGWRGDRARAVGRRRPAGDLPAGVRRRGHAGAAAIAIQEPRALFDPFELQTTARRERRRASCSTASSRSCRSRRAPSCCSSPRGCEGHGPRAVPRRAVDERRAREGRARRWACAPPRPATCCWRASACRRARCSATATRPSTPRLSVARASRWCALSVGTAQAVLDYVIPYVNERVAFGEPISNRQSVAFMVSDIALELEGMRLLTLRAAGRADAGKDVAREAALARVLCAEKGMQIGTNGVQLLGGHGFVKEHPVERWYRDLRAIGRLRGRPARLGGELDDQPRDPQEVRPARRPGAPGGARRCSARSRASTTCGEHAYPKELDMLAALIDGMNEGGDMGGAGAAGVRRNENGDGTTASATAPTCRPCSASSSCAGATSACCCRCRARASATRPSRRSPTTSSSSASEASGPRWRSPSRRPARTPPRIRTTAVLDGDEYVLNGEKIYVTAGERADVVVVWASLDRSRRPRGDQVVRGREGHARA